MLFATIIFDPLNNFGLKIPLMFLLLMFNYKNIEFRYLHVPVYCIFVWLFSYLHALMVGSRIDSGIANWNLNSFLFLFILLFICKKEIKFVLGLYHVCLLYAVYMTFLMLFSLDFSPIQNLVIEHIYNGENFIAYGYRTFLGIDFFSLYHRTSSICIIPEVCALLLFVKTKNKKFILHFVLFFCVLYFAGTRANILASLVIVCGFVFSYILSKRRFILAIGLAVIILVCFVAVILNLSAEDEGSNVIKKLHAVSFMELFYSNPLKFLFFGDGPGAIIYSKGFSRYTSLTELSYYELIKNYGLFFTIIMIVLFCYPILVLLRKQNDINTKFALIIAYLVFFFVAGTNPLFVGSTGYTTIISMFYLCDKKFNEEFDFQYFKDKQHVRPTFVHI
jgi:hypothetical protein